MITYDYSKEITKKKEVIIMSKVVKKRMLITLEEDLIAILDEAAKENRRTKSDEIAIMIQKYLMNNKTSNNIK